MSGLPDRGSVNKLEVSVVGMDAREHLLDRARFLAAVAEDEDRFGEIVRAWTGADREGFVAALKRIPLPNGGPFSEFALLVCQELTDIYVVVVDEIVWAGTGRLFDSDAQLEALQAKKGAGLITPEVWAAIVLWMIDQGVLEVRQVLRPDPDAPVPLVCGRQAFGGTRPPIPFP